MSLFYYPGCSLHATAAEYDASVRDVLSELGVDIREVPDWTCCGATSGHSLDSFLAFGLAARNLLRSMEADRDDDTVVMAPCAACFNRLARAACDMQDQDKRKQIEDILAVSPQGSVRVVNALTLLGELIKGCEGPGRRLEGLKVACYYGCLLVRPPEITGEKYPEQPRSMDRLIQWMGAEPVSWSYRTECCGGNLGLIDSRPVTGVVSEIVSAAREAGADALVTACPLCQANLEMRAGAQKLPTFYFTELLALSMDAITRPYWRKHLIDPVPLLKRLGLE